ncbi:Predicted signal transduction protein [hydrothermal vent metagenome]|uniref:Predicted signal transduction protein n=1 Tax=hydrothermal vent metagenome TaxID=652676 RepID=A0A3B1BWZ2_9ZZZZ
MMEDPATSAKELGEVISRDTGLTARLLKIVNSSFYGFPSKIETVSRAVTVIGLRELRGLVLAASAVETFSKIPTEVLNRVHFWRHSVYCGVVAQLVAEECKVLHSERLFVAGLLHDIGKLIIAHRLPDEMKIIKNRVAAEQRFDFEIEQDVLGFDHSDVGGALLREWKMPPTLCDAVQFHHRPANAKESLMDAAMVHLANSITGMAEEGLDVDIETMIQPIEEEAWSILGLDDSIIETVSKKAGPLFTDALEAILPRAYPD